MTTNNYYLEILTTNFPFLAMLTSYNHKLVMMKTQNNHSLVKMTTNIQYLAILTSNTLYLILSTTHNRYPGMSTTHNHYLEMLTLIIITYNESSCMKEFLPVLSYKVLCHKINHNKHFFICFFWSNNSQKLIYFINEKLYIGSNDLHCTVCTSMWTGTP